MPTATPTRPLHVIGAEVAATWNPMYFGAVPYVAAMNGLNTMTDRYFEDDAASVVTYFLSNAGNWRGDTARRVKAELRSMLAGAK
jgi:hypothetical protein